MGSVVRGRTSELMRVMCVADTPQVHLHYLVEEEDGLGFCRIEFCCHGCGTAHELTYVDEDLAAAFRDGFEKTHSHCSNVARYESWCPDFRLHLLRSDIRDMKTKASRRRTRKNTPISTRTE